MARSEYGAPAAKAQETAGRDRFLSENECAGLLAACKTSSNPNLHHVVMLAISTGMRRNEILSLRFDQIDLTRGMIYLYDTKNGERRGVPLAGPALELMRQRAELKGNEKISFSEKQPCGSWQQAPQLSCDSAGRRGHRRSRVAAQNSAPRGHGQARASPRALVACLASRSRKRASYRATDVVAPRMIPC